MCGIIGVYVKDNSKIAQRLREVHENQAYRGKEGAGFAIRRADGSVIRTRFRFPEKALRFAEEQGFEAGDLVMFHHRFPTSTPNDPAFNHPIANEDMSLFLIHNGHISNSRQLFSELGEKHQFETLLVDEKTNCKDITDSEVMLHLLDENLGSEGLVGAFKPMSDKVSGSYAIGVMSKHEDRLWLFKQGNPIVVFNDPEGNIWFASVFPNGKDYTQITELVNGELGYIDATGYVQVKVYEDETPKTPVYHFDLSDFGFGSRKKHKQDGRRYCPHCGEEIPDGEKFCEWCWGNGVGR